MGERTSINRATTNSVSLRTTIPLSVVTHLGLREKDELDWEITAEKNRLVVKLKPAKARKTRSRKN
mgnify:CR=1 FL=1